MNSYLSPIREPIFHSQQAVNLCYKFLPFHSDLFTLQIENTAGVVGNDKFAVGLKYPQISWNILKYVNPGTWLFESSMCRYKTMNGLAWTNDGRPKLADTIRWSEFIICLPLKRTHTLGNDRSGLREDWFLFGILAKN